MRIEAAKKLFSVDDYYRIAEVGILGPEDRVEVIDGEIVQMSPIGDRRALCVSTATELFILTFHGKGVVRTQNPLRLNDYSEPEPDIVLLKSEGSLSQASETTGHSACRRSLGHDLQI